MGDRDHPYLDHHVPVDGGTTYADLRSIAQEVRIPGWYRMNKLELIGALNRRIDVITHPERHKVTIDGGLPGVRTGKRTEAVARCTCGATARAATRAAARNRLIHIPTD